MGNKLSCNCGPLSRKPYRYEDTPWSAGSSSRSFNKRDGHLLRLWAEVFHVSSAGGGTVKWQQVSEDLVPVNITCVQDSPEVVFHITAYNSQVDKILDVRLVQPGTRIGQASECFVYWKDPVTSDTWGLNFTSPIDAKQFRECCSPAFKFSRKASSSYSLRLENAAVRGGGAQTTVATTGRAGFERGGASAGGSRGGSGRISTTSGAAGRRRPVSTPTSPSKVREPQCTCMTAEQYARLRAMDPRFRAASTLPTRTAATTGGSAGRKDGVQGTEYATLRRTTESKGIGTASDIEEGRTGERMRGRSIGRGGREILASKSVDYADGGDSGRESTIDRKKNRSKSTDDVNRVTTGSSGKQVVSQQQQTEMISHPQAQYANTGRVRTLAAKATIGTNTTPTGDGLTDSQTLKRLLKPIPVSAGSVVTSPEMARRVYYHDGYISEPEIRHVSTLSRESQTGRRNDTLRRAQERSRGVGTQTGYGKKSDMSPTDHRHYHHNHPTFDHAYYATTPPSSSPEGDVPKNPSPGSPTARLLLEYEQHLRNTLAKGMDAESYSLHTFEAIISQSNENLAVPPNSRSTTLPRFVPSSSSTSTGTRGDQFRISSREASRESRDSDVLSGYYSDFRDRGYLSDHNSRSSGPYDRHEMGSVTKSGYFSDRENRSGYFSDRDIHVHHKFGGVSSSVRQQASVESADSRLCYLTSSEEDEDEDSDQAF